MSVSGEFQRARSKGQETVAALHRYQDDPARYAERSGATDLTATRVQRLSQLMDNPWSPHWVVVVTVGLFRLKLVAALFAGVLLCLFVGEAIVC